jgi:hypothetical protein
MRKASATFADLFNEVIDVAVLSNVQRGSHQPFKRCQPLFEPMKERYSNVLFSNKGGVKDGENDVK